MKRLRGMFRIGLYRERSVLDEWTHFFGQQHCYFHFYMLSQGSRCYEMKCITRVSYKVIPQIIVGKYGTSSICSARMIRENLTRF